MIFDRVKPLDAILAAAEKKSLSRSLGWFQLTLMGIGCVIGTGIFVLTAVGAQKAGPGLMIAFAIAGGVCIVAALCYAEIAAMIPVAGSAYTYSYATIGEFFAWTVGWALIMEYAIAASAVSVGWSGYFSGTVLGGLGIHLPAWLSAGPLALGGAAGGFINLPALVIALLVTGLLVIGTSESAKVNAVLVIVKVTALTAFVAITLTSSEFEASHFNPFLPAGVFGGWGTGVGAVGAAATMFFAYVGFDAVSTAAEETKNPQRNVPIGLVGSLLFCTVFYILVAAGAIGTIGGQPIMGPNGVPFPTGAEELARQCATYAADQLPLVCSNEALAHVLRQIGWSSIGNLLGIAAFLALPSVILVLIYGQTRIFFVMARDGLLPERLSRVHPKFKTPHIVTMLTGGAVALGAAFFPVGKLADISNAGTLYAFTMVAVALLVLRRRDPSRKRAFRVPAAWLIAPLTIAGCVFLFLNLPYEAMLFLPGWGLLGIVIYFAYSRSRSHLGRGIVEVVDDVAGEQTMVPIEPPPA